MRRLTQVVKEWIAWHVYRVSYCPMCRTWTRIPFSHAPHFERSFGCPFCNPQFYRGEPPFKRD